MHKIIKFTYKNWRLWLITLPPIGIWLFIFPFKLVEIRNSCGPLDPPVFYSDIDKPGIKRLVVDTFQIPLNLRLYDLYFKYNIRPSRGWLMTDPMTLLVRLNSDPPLIPADGLNPIPTDSVPDLGLDTSHTYRIPADKDINFYYSGGNKFSCTASASGGKFERNQAVLDKDVPDLVMGFGVELGLVKIIAETDKWSWITTFFVLCILWSALVLLINETRKFIIQEK